jgi:hypothetical protein
LIVKALWAVDLPALLIAILPALLITPLIGAVHLGTFETSYVEASEFLIASSLQWLTIGRRLEVGWKQRKLFRTRE